MKSDLVVFFKDGYSSPVDLAGDSGQYRDNGISHRFAVGLAERRDGVKRVVFLDGAQEQQADPWIASIGKQPGLVPLSLSLTQSQCDSAFGQVR